MGSERKPRRIEGIKYHYVDAYDKRSDAETTAKYLRGSGWSVRILREKYSFASKPYKRTVFSVWHAQKASKK